MLSTFGRWILKLLTQRKMDRFYAKRDDPYRFRSSRFNQERFEAMVACLGDGRPSRALEIGASQGDFTERLAPRVARLTAIEVSEVAIRRAQDRLAALRNVDWVCDDIRTWNPPRADFDLIVLSDVLCYLEKPLARREFDRQFSRVAGWLAPSGRLLLVNGFLGPRERVRRLGYRERFERLGLKLVSEQLIAIDPAEEPVQSLVSLLEKSQKALG